MQKKLTKVKVNDDDIKNTVYLEKIFYDATNNYKYRWGVNKFKTFLKKHPDLIKKEDILCKLGLLYDHLAFKEKNKRQVHEKKAFELYKKALKYNPNSFRAVWGIGRIWWHRRNKKAIPYAIKAYKLAKKSKTDYGINAQCVGLVYEAIGDYKNAEKWLLKGIKIEPKNWGCYLNLVGFYRLIKQFSKSKFYAKKLESLFKKETKEFKKTLWGQKILQTIKDADKELKKKKGG